ncbi:MAG: T9SS type A sorting domain-containing protein [Bacteroidales bacterium]|nr:T9SS type A sorting domain-containing protein [Bacteroidales bacterium]
MKKLFVLFFMAFCLCALNITNSCAQAIYTTDITVVYANSQSEDQFEGVTKFYFSNGNLVLDQSGTLTTIPFSTVHKLLLQSNQQPGIESYDLTAPIIIYPNPTSDRLYFVAEREQQVDVQIYSMDGKLLQKESMSTESSIDVSRLSKGMYIIRINEQAYKFSKL